MSPSVLYSLSSMAIDRRHRGPWTARVGLLRRFFDEKIAAIRTSTAVLRISTPSPAAFRVLVITAIRELPSKLCATDSLPTCLLTDNENALAPFIAVQLVVNHNVSDAVRGSIDHAVTREARSGPVTREIISAHIKPRCPVSVFRPESCRSATHLPLFSADGGCCLNYTINIIHST